MKSRSVARGANQVSKSVASGGIASKRNRVIVALRPSVITCRRAEFPHYTFSSAQFAISDPSCRNFSSSRDSNRNEPKIPPRPWLDRKLPFDVRVQKLLEAKVGTLDHHVVEFDTTGLAEHCCRLRDFVGMKFAHDVLDRVLAEKRYHDENKNPNQLPFLVPAKLFQTILYGWCNLATKGKIARVRMRETLDLMLEVVKQDDKLLDSIAAAPENGNIRQIFQEERLLPTVNTYNTVLTGLGNAARVSRDAAVEAEEVLKEMQMNHKKFGWHTKPNTKSFSLVIAAYATSGLKYSGKNAERLLRQIQKIHEEEKQLYMEEYGVPYNTRDVSANRRKIVTADAIIYTHVIKAHSHRCSPYEAGKVRDLLIEAMSMDDGTVQLDAALFTSAINAFASVAQNMKLPSDQRFLAAQHAEEILMVMLEQTRFPLESPQTGQAKKKKIDMAAPFNASMNAYAKCGSPKAAYRAESMLQKLISSYIDGESTIQPNTISFNSVLSAWSHCGVYYPDAPQKAEELLKLQLDLLESGSLGKSATPDTQAFSVVISTYARSNLPDKVQQAYRLLQQMLAGVSEGKVLPGKNNVIPFTGVLNAAAHPSSKSNKGGSDTNNKQSTSTSSAIETPGEDFNTIQSDDDYSIALQTYREMKEDVYNIGCKPDHMTFSTMLYVVDAHTQKGSIERRQMVQTLFEDACAAGEVSRLVLKALRSVCPDSTLYASLLGSSELAASIKTVDELPRTWTRNVSQNYRILKRDHTQ